MLAGLAAIVALGGAIQCVLPNGFRLDDWTQCRLFGPLDPESGMSLGTACCILGAAVGILLRDARPSGLRRIGAVTALFGFVAAAVGALGYAYASAPSMREARSRGWRWSPP